MKRLQRETLEEINNARANLQNLQKCRPFVDAADKKVDERQRIEMAYVEAAMKRNEQLLEFLKKELQMEI